MKNLLGIIRSLICPLMNIPSGRFSLRELAIGGIIFIFMTQSLIAAGIIKGRVFDKHTTDVLPGANILIKGTSIGAAADQHGMYTISHVPTGEQTIVVSYIGYVTMNVVVTVPEGGTLQQDFGLEPVVLKGEEVVVTAQAVGQMKAINTQLTARTIKNVVAAEKIQELPDESAAAALSRLPGLSLQEGDKVVIRGLQAKMNTILINGVALPSTDMQDRSTNLGFISSNMLAGIEVTKVLTPDMDANTIGGVVDLRIKEAPVGLHFDVLTQSMYNTQDRTSDNYKFWASISNRFFNDKLGIFVQGNADRTNGGLDLSEASYGIMDNNIAYGHSPYFMNGFRFIDEENIITNYGGSVILDYQLPAGKIILQNTLAHTQNDNAQHRTLYGFNPMDLVYSVFRDNHNKELLINALQGEYNFGFIKMNMGLAHSYSDKETDNRYGDPGNNFNFENSWTNVLFLSQTGDTLTADDFQDDDRLKLKPQDIYRIVIPDDNWKNAAIDEWCVTRSEAFKQHLYNANLDFIVPTSFLNLVSGNIKFGGKFNRSTRTNDANETYHRVGAADFYYSVKDFIPGKTLTGANDPNARLTLSDIRNNNYNRGKYFLNGDYEYKYAFDIDRLDQFMVQVQDGWNHIPDHVAKSLRDDFKGNETFSAGYLMGDFNIGSKLSLIGGLRYEHYNMDYKANIVNCTHDVDGDVGPPTDTLSSRVDRNDADFFPNVQLRYKYVNWGDVRIAYTKSIIRPDYRAIIPMIYFGGTAHMTGNPLLKPTISDNYDLHFSFYSNKIGLFTIGGFYKKMQDIFFQTAIYYQNLHLYDVSFPDATTWTAWGSTKVPKASDQVTTFLNNPSPAYVNGLEFEWQTNFWYLPRPLNALVLNINYARIWSEIDYQDINNWQTDSTIIVNNRPKIIPVYHSMISTRKGRLLNQGDHILNIALGIDYKDFSGRLSFNLQSDVISYIGVRPEEDQYTGDIYKWDLSLRQKLPIPGLSIAFNGVNIFHNVVKTYQKFPNVAGGPINENLFRTSYAPRKFELNLRYSL
ncbi:MAG: TonB-dependent receptor [candidate division KSB1 bacterium]|nr:TonB-dependent receptor [candidate division KSB1 bacterium]